MPSGMLRAMCAEKVQATIDKSSHPLKEDIIVFIMDLSGDEACEEWGTEAWVNLIDRGGLWHVNDNTTYALFKMIVSNKILLQSVICSPYD